MGLDRIGNFAAPPPPFDVNGLWQSLARLDQMLERATAAADAAASAATTEPYRGLYITSDDVQRLIRRPAGEPHLAAAPPDARAGVTADGRFTWLQDTFTLDPIDLDVVLLALAPEIDLRYERLFAYLHDDVTRRRPSVDLALNLLCATREAKIAARRRFSPDAPLLRHRLLQLVADTSGPAPPLLAHVLKLEEPVVRFLVGHSAVDARLQPMVRLVPFAGEHRSQERGDVDRAIGNAIASGSRPHFYLEGPTVGVKEAVAVRIAADLGLSLLVVDVQRAITGADVEGTLDALWREARLLGAVLYLEQLDAAWGAERGPVADALEKRLAEAADPVFATGERPCNPRFSTLTTVIVAEPGFHERREIWASATREHAVELTERALDDLSARYRLTDTQIRQAVDSTVRQASLGASKPGATDLAKAARQQSRRDPGTLARRVTPFYGWTDLVLPSDQMMQLRELCQQARHRHVVYGDWGFDRKLSLGKGLTALFSGPPGTGKTMAVEVIANDLGLELYKIDLSQVVSKYIGETEKNMDRLFSDARASNAILFFDECDALFGKRTTVHDAHDRYANIEIAYLLQKLDEHEGLSILASNLRQNLDAAFTRRLTFIVEFPFPDDESRRRIWRSIWPVQVPRSPELDLEFMATQFKLPGGAVKNIAVSAAFLAAEERSALKTEHLLWAARRELEKAGRRVPRSEFGRYADRVDARLEAEAQP